MTHTRTFTYEERAMELALEASDLEAGTTTQSRTLDQLGDWVKEMPEKSRARVRAAAELLLAATPVTDR